MKAPVLLQVTTLVPLHRPCPPRPRRYLVLHELIPLEFASIVQILVPHSEAEQSKATDCTGSSFDKTI